MTKKRERNQGKVPEGRIGVYDRNRNLRGHVGPKATSVTAARFHNELGATLSQSHGWCTCPQCKTLAATSAAAVGMQQKNTGTNPAANMPPPPKPPSMVQNLNAAKGSTK